MKLGHLLISLVLALPLLPHAPAAANGDSLFAIEDVWATAEGKSFRLRDLAGHPSAIAMIYTACKGQCPLIVEDMKKVERLLPATAKEEVSFVLFSFDSARDTPSKMREFAKAHGILRPRWILLHGGEGAARRLEVALGLKVKKTRTGDFEHSNLISVLDAQGAVKYRQVTIGETGEPIAAALNNLLKK